MKFIFAILALFISLTAGATNLNNTRLSLTTASVTTSSGQVLVANPARKYLLIQNNGSASIYIKFDTTIAGTEGIVIPAGGSYEPIIAPMQAIYMKAVSGTNSVTIYEGI